LKVIYHCYGGAHASPTAAAIHLGHISGERRPTFREMLQIPFFDQLTSESHGKLVKAGIDHLGNEVYFMGRRREEKLVMNLIREFSRFGGVDPSEFYFVNCVQLLNPFMVTGGFSSRGMGWVGFGRPIVTFGTILSFPIIAGIVRKVIHELEVIRERNRDGYA
jgi:hypothetical protein